MVQIWGESAIKGKDAILISSHPHFITEIGSSVLSNLNMLYYISADMAD